MSDINKEIVDQIESGQLNRCQGNYYTTRYERKAADAVDMKRVEMSVDWANEENLEQITTILSEAKFKLPRDQKEVKKQTEKVGGRTLDIRYGRQISEAKFMSILMVSMGDPIET